MSPWVLDSSALLAWLWREPGWERVDEILGKAECWLCSVNQAEIFSKVLDKGLPPSELEGFSSSLDIPVASFDPGLALATGALRPGTRALGLSLGDRACLALAQQLGATALTADRAWTQLDLGIAVECIRE
ncbi:MAG: type II toxin-antitoxin system VapC family toxin [Pseudomonadota bacterium]